MSPSDLIFYTMAGFGLSVFPTLGAAMTGQDPFITSASFTLVFLLGAAFSKRW